MSQTLRKRCREPEVLPESMDVREPKRFYGEETERFLHLLQLDETLVDEEEECALSEELVNGVMRSLEEEISTSSTYRSSNIGENSAAHDISGGDEGQTRDSNSGDHLCYLLEASDDELGIPPSSVPVLKGEDCLCRKETSEGLLVNQNLKFLGENWHFEDDFENYQQFGLYENFSDAIQFEDYLSRDFVSPTMLFDVDFSTWELETASGM